MALVSLSGQGMFYPKVPDLVSSLLSATAVGPIDATGEKAAYLGRVWFPDRTGTKNVRYVCFLFGTVVKAGGSALTVSLQDVSLTSGPPAQPDGVADQTVAIANADAAFVTGGWLKTAALSADRTVSFGERLAVVVEYDGSGRQGSDSFYLQAYAPAGGASVPAGATPVQYVGAPAWASVSAWGNVILEFSDGTFGTLDTCFVASASNTHTANVDTGTADEFALNLQVPFPCKVDGLWARVNSTAATADFELIIYSGTTALQTVAVDGNAYVVSGAGRNIVVPIPATALTKNTLYRVAVRPTVTGTAGNVSCYSIDVADANHFSVQDGGINLQYSTRLDQGAWSAATATRRLLAGVRICELDSGGVLINPGLSGGLR